MPLASQLNPYYSAIPQTNTMVNGVTGQNPAPGGPNPMTQNQQMIGNQSPAMDLRKQIAENMSKAQDQLGQTTQALGLTPTAPKSFQERGILVGNKVVAANEAANTKNLQDQAIRDYLQQANFGTEMQSMMARQTLEDKFNKLRIGLITQAQAFDAKLRQQGINDAQRRAAAKTWGSLAGMAVGGILGTMAVPGVGTMAGISVGGAAGGAVGEGMGG